MKRISKSGSRWNHKVGLVLSTAKFEKALHGMKRTSRSEHSCAGSDVSTVRGALSSTCPSHELRE
ncbi:MAG: hypothetical protein CTY40_02455 [Hyphomicrobium sp.]|nr:MAG: hypothetical protein CTY40_02455 [Hyphomicrobium sp.]